MTETNARMTQEGGGGGGPPSPSEQERGPGATAEAVRARGAHALEDILNQAKGLIEDAADGQKERAARELSSIARALHETARHLLTEDEKTMARYTELAAEQIDRMSRFVHQSNWGDLVEGAEDFARRQPAWFIGGAMMSGFILARFLKSAGPETGPETGAATGMGGGTATSAPPAGEGVR